MRRLLALEHIAIGARIQSSKNIFLLIASRKDDHFQIGQLAFYVSSDLNAINIRQSNINQGNIRAYRFDAFPGLGAIGGITDNLYAIHVAEEVGQPKAEK